MDGWKASGEAGKAAVSELSRRPACGDAHAWRMHAHTPARTHGRCEVDGHSPTGSSTFSRYNRYAASASVSYKPSLIPAGGSHAREGREGGVRTSAASQTMGGGRTDQ